MTFLQTTKIIQEVNNLTVSDVDIKTETTENLCIIDLINIGVSMFEFLNSPVESRLIERTLFTKGNAMFFKHKTLGYFVLPYVLVGGLNVYGEPTTIKPIAIGEQANLFNDTYTVGEDCVIIRDNPYAIAPILYSYFYGKKIATLFSDREKNNTWLRLPMIFKSTGDVVKDSKTLKQATKILLDDQFEVSVVTDIFNLLETVNVKIQYLGAEIQEQMKSLRNEYLQFLGIDHNEEKKERKTTAEVLVENEENSISLTKRLLPRLYAIKQINDIFGLDLKLKINNDISSTEDVNVQSSVDSKAELFKLRAK